MSDLFLDTNLRNPDLTDLSLKICRESRMMDGYAPGVEALLATVLEEPDEPVCISAGKVKPGSRYCRLALEQIVIPARKLSGTYGTFSKGKPGRAGCFHPNPFLLSRLQSVQASNTFDEVILLREQKWWDWERATKTADLIDYTDTAETNVMRDGLRRYNSFMAGFTVKDATGTRHSTSLVRIFNNSSFDCGGRFYRASYQGLKSAERSMLTIDGQTLVELDFAAVHPTMLFLQAELEPKDDPYTVPGIARNHLKLAFNVAVNAESEAAAVGCLEQHLKDRQLAERCVQALHEHLPDVAQHLCTGIGVKLQRLDSNIAALVMADFVRHQKPVLVMHDSFLVHPADEALLQTTMTWAFQKVLDTFWPPTIKGGTGVEGSDAA